MKTDHSEYIIAALSGTTVGGFASSAFGDPLVHQILGGIVSALCAMAGVWIMAWWKAKVAKQFPPAVASIAEKAAQDLAPLIEQYGHELVTRVVTRAALTASVRPEALAPMTGKYPAVPGPPALPKVGT